MIICFMCGQQRVVSLGVKDGINVFSCGNCHVIYTNPTLMHRARHYYRYGNYSQKKQKIKNLPPFDERFNHDIAVAEARIRGVCGFEKTIGFLRGLKVLDVGAANGAMMCALKNSLALPFGVEPDDVMRRFIANKTNEEFSTFIDITEVSQRQEEFDLITFFDSLEHANDPLMWLFEANALLKNGGNIVIEQPDPSSERAGVDGIDWKHIKPTEHVFLLSPGNVKTLLLESGFECTVEKQFMEDRFNIIGVKVCNVS